MKRVFFVALIFLFSTNAYALNCLDYKNQLAKVVPNPQLNDVATVRHLPNGQGVIYFNPAITNQLSSVMRDFIFAHECAHLALGHGIIRPVNEQVADCWAIRTLADFGLNQNGLSQLQQELTAFGGSGDWTHAPGYVRSKNLYHCLQ